ncbi:hypothetical protein C8R44DRAFT_8118 [Mycena epipterygia]|nr:hypothetical protein C8R44DRAFT_8118 [Mycena epipterygia]
MNAPKPGLVTPIGPSQVAESRTQRIARQQSRFRDRGGIFVPRAHNNLLDILLGRKQPSPLKRRSRSRSLSVSPTKRPPKSNRGASARPKSGGTGSKAPARRKSSKIPAGDTHDPNSESGQPVAGPSRLPDAVEKPSSKVQASRKGKKTVAADDDALTESKPAPKRKGRNTKSKQTIQEPTKTTAKSTTQRKRTKVLTPDDPVVHSDNEAPVASTKRTTASKAKTSRKTVATDDLDLGEGDATAKASNSKGKSSKSSAKTDITAPATKPNARSKARAAKASEEQDADPPPPPRTQRSRAVKSRKTYTELSDDEDAEEPPKARSGTAVKALSAPDVVADTVPGNSVKKKGKQREVDDDVAPTSAASKVNKTKGKGKAREQEAEEPVKSKAKTVKRKRALEHDPPGDGDSESARPIKRRKPASLPKENDEPSSRTRLEVILEEDEDEDETAAPVKIPARPIKADASTAKKPKASSKKRPRDEDVKETTEQTPSKRAKVAKPKDVPTAPAKLKKRAPAKRSKSAVEKGTSDGTKHVQIPSRKLKENTPTSLALPPEQQKPAAKPVLVVTRTGPPKSVLDRVRAHTGSRLVPDDNEPDELDFLS